MKSKVLLHFFLSYSSFFRQEALLILLYTLIQLELIYIYKVGGFHFLLDKHDTLSSSLFFSCCDKSNLDNSLL